MSNGVLHWFKPKINEEVEEYVIMVCLFIDLKAYAF